MLEIRLLVAFFMFMPLSMEIKAKDWERLEPLIRATERTEVVIEGCMNKDGCDAFGEFLRG